MPLLAVGFAVRAAWKGAAIAAAVLVPLKLMLALLRSRRAAARHPKAAPKEAGQPAPTGRWLRRRFHRHIIIL
jgi:hypothetical protein